MKLRFVIPILVLFALVVVWLSCNPAQEPAPGGAPDLKAPAAPGVPPMHWLRDSQGRLVPDDDPRRAKLIEEEKKSRPVP